MSATFTPGQIERFKRVAKSMHRASELSHSQALDHVATANGYANWSLLMKHNPSGEASPTTSGPRPFLFTRTLDEMRFALRKVPEPRAWGRPTRSDLAKQKVTDISGAFVSPLNAVEFAIGYVECLLQVPRFRVYAASQVYWEMRMWLPYCCHELDSDQPGRILVNRHYKPVGHTAVGWAEYCKYSEFPNLHTELTGPQCRRFTRPLSREGFLFSDGCAPWSSRTDAGDYLESLYLLRKALSERAGNERASGG